MGESPFQQSSGIKTFALRICVAVHAGVATSGACLLMVIGWRVALKLGNCTVPNKLKQGRSNYGGVMEMTQQRILAATTNKGDQVHLAGWPVCLELIDTCGPRHLLLHAPQLQADRKVVSEAARLSQSGRTCI